MCLSVWVLLFQPAQEVYSNSRPDDTLKPLLKGQNTHSLSLCVCLCVCSTSSWPLTKQFLSIHPQITETYDGVDVGQESSVCVCVCAQSSACVNGYFETTTAVGQYSLSLSAYLVAKICINLSSQFSYVIFKMEYWCLRILTLGMEKQTWINDDR